VIVPTISDGSGDQGIGSSTYGLLNLNNLNALQNATLALGASFGPTNTTSFNSLANSGTFNVGALSGSGNVRLADTAGSAVALSVGGNNSSTAHSGNLTGAGSLHKAGTGRLTLSGTNVYTGTTTVGGGTLMVNGTHVGGDNYHVNSSGILGGSGRITPKAGAGIIVDSGGTLTPGADGVIRTLTLDGSGTDTTLLTLAPLATLSFNLFTGLVSDQVAMTNAAVGDFVANDNVVNFTDLSAGNLAIGQYILITSDTANTYSGLTLSGSDIIGGLAIGSGLTGYTADLEVSGNNIVLDITAVPEPTTVALIGLGGLAALVIRRRKV
jgi:autotransporter-associated beta strand protein